MAVSIEFITRKINERTTGIESTLNEHVNKFDIINTIFQTASTAALMIYIPSRRVPRYISDIDRAKFKKGMQGETLKWSQKVVEKWDELVEMMGTEKRAKTVMLNKIKDEALKLDQMVDDAVDQNNKLAQKLTDMRLVFSVINELMPPIVLDVVSDYIMNKERGRVPPVSALVDKVKEKLVTAVSRDARIKAIKSDLNGVVDATIELDQKIEKMVDPLLSGSANALVDTRGGNLNVRSTASTKSRVVGKLANGTAIEIDAQEGNFYRIKSPQAGFVSKNYVSRLGETEAEKVKRAEARSRRVEVTQKNQSNQSNQVGPSDGGFDMRFLIPIVGIPAIYLLTRE